LHGVSSTTLARDDKQKHGFEAGRGLGEKNSRVFLWVNRAEGAFAPPHKLLAGHAVTIPKGRLKPGKLIRAAP